MGNKHKLPRTRERATASSILGKKGYHGGGLYNYASVSKSALTTAPSDNFPQLKGDSYIYECIAPADSSLDSTRKRKLVAVENDLSPVSYKSHNAKIKRRVSGGYDPNPQTPCRPICLTEKRRISSTERARGLLDKLFISNTPTRSHPSSYGVGSSASQAASRCSPFSQSGPPSDVIDLVNLYSAFLTAYSIHCAHNGTHCPADQKIICYEVTRIWKKRNVKLIDLQRLLGVVNANTNVELESRRRLSRLTLSDYGNEKICIEISEIKGNVGKVARPVNVDLMNKVFTRGLHAEWRKWNGDNIQEFIDSLPLEPITRCASYLRISPLLAKGQRRLESICDGKSTVRETTKKYITDSGGKKTTLLERLRAKQMHQLQMPLPSSNSDILRKMSLARLNEVFAVLTVLSTSSSFGQKRVSFTLPTVLGRLKDSLNIGKEEGVLCIKLMATEIAPEWIKIVSFRKKEALVVERDVRPEDMEIRERIKRAEMNLNPS